MIKKVHTINDQDNYMLYTNNDDENDYVDYLWIMRRRIIIIIIIIIIILLLLL